MKQSWTLSYFLTVLGYLLVLFILWSVTNGTFDISQWSESYRENYGIVGGVGSIIIFVVKLFID